MAACLSSIYFHSTTTGLIADKWAPDFIMTSAWCTICKCKREYVFTVMMACTHIHLHVKLIKLI